MPHTIAIVDLRDNFYSICMYLMFTDILFAIYIFNQKKRFHLENKNWLHEYTARVWELRCTYNAYCLKFSTKWNGMTFAIDSIRNQSSWWNDTSWLINHECIRNQRDTKTIAFICSKLIGISHNLISTVLSLAAHNILLHNFLSFTLNNKYCYYIVA